MKLELNIDGKEKIFTVAFIKSRMLRKLLEIKKRMDFENIQEDELDELVAFVCEVFGNQFSVDDVYDGLPLEKLMPTITSVMNAASGSAAGNSGDDESKKK